MAVHIHPVEIPPKYYKPLGQIAAGSNLTEALITSLICHIHGIKNVNRGRLFVYRPMAKQKLQIFAHTIKRFVPDAALKSELQRLHSIASDLNTKRNMLIHGLWGRMPNEKVWKVFYHNNVDDMWLLKRKEQTVDDVKKVANDVRKLNRELKKLMTRIGAPPP